MESRATVPCWVILLPLLPLHIISKKAKKDVGISGISQVLQIIRDNVREKTEKFSFFIVEEMEPCRRPEKGDQKPSGLPLPGISKFLYIYFNSKGSVRGKELSCKQCSVRQICSQCDK